MTTAEAARLDHETARPIRNVLVIARQAQHLTQAELGARMGVAQAQIAQWENATHTPNVHSLALWADALGYEIALLPKVTAVLPEAVDMPGAAL